MAAVLEELDVGLAGLAGRGRFPVLRGLAIQRSSSLFDSRECHNVVVVLSPFLDLQYLRLVLLGEEITDRLLIFHVRHEKTVALLLVALGNRRFGWFLWLRSTVSFASGRLL